MIKSVSKDSTLIISRNYYANLTDTPSKPAVKIMEGFHSTKPEDKDDRLKISKGHSQNAQNNVHAEIRNLEM